MARSTPLQLWRKCFLSAVISLAVCALLQVVKVDRQPLRGFPLGGFTASFTDGPEASESAASDSVWSTITPELFEPGAEQDAASEEHLPQEAILNDETSAQASAQESRRENSSPGGMESVPEAQSTAPPVAPLVAADTVLTVPPVGGGKTSEAPLVVALAAGLRQLEDVLVVANSALAHASQQERLQFRIITQATEAAELGSKLRARLPSGADLQTVAFDAWVPRVSRLVGGKSSRRAELFDPMNFAAFYLHELFPGAGRVLYLDVDVVVLADLAKELRDRDMKGRPMAVARDCSQKVGKYVDVDRLKKRKNTTAVIARLKLDKKMCVVNRGVVLVDVVEWTRNNITEIIEQLVEAHLDPAIGPLWRAGVSQPPFLLAANKRFLDLGPEYNVRGLGRGDIAPDEVSFYRKQNLWSPYFDDFLLKCEFNCCPGCKGWSLTPHVSPIADHAKILHFNGRLKPSKAGRRSSAPLPKPKLPLSKEERSARELRPLCSCGPQCMRECAGLWWKYLPAPK